MGLAAAFYFGIDFVCVLKFFDSAKDILSRPSSARAAHQNEFQPHFRTAD
jgi:hypothetical protein